MNSTIEKLGARIDAETERNPARARKMLSLAYRFVGQKSAHFPSASKNSSREYMQGYVSNLMADLLNDPAESAVVNIFMPSELFHALDIPIMAPEALSLYVANTAAERAFIDKAEERGASETLCSYHRCLLGLCETGVMKKPLLVANTTLACDANQLTFRRLAQKWNVPHSVIEVPYRIDGEAVQYVAEQLKDLARLTQDISGKTLQDDRLRMSLENSRLTIRNYRRYLTERMDAHFAETMTPELFLDITNHLFLGTPEAVKFTDLLLHDVRKAPRHTTEQRILWMHILPNWQDSLLSILQGAENHHIEVVASDMAYSSMAEPDPDHPFESMARRLVMDSYNGPGIRRIEQTLSLAKKMKVEGILIYCQWGCKQTQGIALKAKECFEAEGFPTLIVDGDSCDRQNGGAEQIVTRVNAFAEQLEGAFR